MKDKSIISTKFVAITSIVWITVFVAFYVFELFDRPTTFYELSGVLAGVFTPLTLWWLIYGYCDQTKSNALNIQAIADQMKAMHNAAKPILRIYSIQYSKADKKEITFQVVNVGQSARCVEIYRLDANEEYQMGLDILKSDEEYKFALALNQNDKISLTLHKHATFRIAIRYSNQLGGIYSDYYDFTLVRSNGIEKIDCVRFENDYRSPLS